MCLCSTLCLILAGCVRSSYPTSIPPNPTAIPASPLPFETPTSPISEVSLSRLAADITALTSIPTRHVNSPGSAQAADYIEAGFRAAGGRLEVRTQEFPLTWAGISTTQRNVIAVLPGADPQAGFILIGAHTDSRTFDLKDSTSPAPGANDNASGVAAVIELARLLANSTPQATLVFAAFAAEEVGHQGSDAYVQAALARGESYQAVIILDIIGNAAGPAGAGSVRVFSAPPEDSPSRRLAYQFEQIGEEALTGFDVQVQSTLDRPGRYSDHVPFSEAGIPAVRLIEPIEDLTHQHSASDTPDRVSMDYVAQITRLVRGWLFAFSY